MVVMAFIWFLKPKHRSSELQPPDVKRTRTSLTASIFKRIFTDIVKVLITLLIDFISGDKFELC